MYTLFDWNSSPLFLIAGAYSLNNEKSDQNMSLKDSLWHFFRQNINVLLKIKRFKCKFQKESEDKFNTSWLQFHVVEKKEVRCNRMKK